MEPAIAPMGARPAPAAEDAARAGFYALLSRLFYGPPDEALLKTLAQSEDIDAESPTSSLAPAWRALKEASAAADPAALRQEYDDLFVGTGKARITLYASFHLTKTGGEKVLVRLRDDLLGFGLARKSSASEPEDHVAALFDVMRFLILNGSGDDALHNQEVFFNRYCRKPYGPLCDAITAENSSFYYRHVARFARTFLDVESDALNML